MLKSEPDISPKSLAETTAEAFPLELARPATPVGGCLLQIYPAVPTSELIRLKPGRTLIGRDPSCDVTLHDSAISRIHATVDLDTAGVWVSDLTSTNGTYIDDKRLRERKALKGGELIRVGAVLLKYISGSDEEAQYHAVVRDLVARDPLTNTFNRGYLIPMLAREIEQLSATPNRPLSVILMDIDHFKRINDNHGHLIGDEVLRIFCERIRAVLREQTPLARYGGEEFVAVLTETSVTDAYRVAERLRLAVSSEPFSTQAGRVPVSCSLGVASTAGLNTPAVDALLGLADQMLYSAKEHGRNAVRTADPDETHSPKQS